MPVTSSTDHPANEDALQPGNTAVEKGDSPSSKRPVYTCPMHPEIKQTHSGDCPKCGMALERKTAIAGTGQDENAELRDMTKQLLDRRRASFAGVCPSDGSLDPGGGQTTPGRRERLTLDAVCAPHTGRCIGRVAVFPARWRSIVTLQLNMFTLMAIGVSAAFLRNSVLVLFGQVLEPRPRSPMKFR